MPAPRLLIGLGVLAAAVVLFLVLRPGGDDESEPVAGVTTAATERSETAETAVETGPEAPEIETETRTEEELDEPDEEPAPDEPEPATLAIVVREGLPEGGTQRLTVRRGEEVRIVVRSDTADELHLHGYDLVRPVGPGAPAQFRFRATVPGVFELETHERAVLVGEIEVRP